VIIDCHTHICPDRIAKVVEEIMSRRFHTPLYGSMTVEGILTSMEQCGISMSVVFNVAERTEIVKAANDFIIKACKDRRLIGFGTIHPQFEDYQEEIIRLKANGIKGVKFHSLVQDFYADEPHMLHIYELLEREGLVAYFHCGKDPGDPSAPAKTSPQLLAKVLDLLPRLKVVAAHFGGLYMLEEVKTHLIGREVFLDTSWSPSVEVLDPGDITELIKEHGSHRFLFATDYPTTDRKRQMEWILRLPLSKEEQQKIMGGNARGLFAL